MIIEIQSAAPPLKPGETGMKTNGPMWHWYRIDGGDWERAEGRTLYKIKLRVTEALEHA